MDLDLIMATQELRVQLLSKQIQCFELVDRHCCRTVDLKGASWVEGQQTPRVAPAIKRGKKKKTKSISVTRKSPGSLGLDNFTGVNV